jgi:hypothetical protein
MSSDEQSGIYLGSRGEDFKELIYRPLIKSDLDTAVTEVSTVLGSNDLGWLVVMMAGSDYCETCGECVVREERHVCSLVLIYDRCKREIETELNYVEFTAPERYYGVIREWYDEPSSNTRSYIVSCVKEAFKGIFSFPYYLDRNNRDRYRFNGGDTPRDPFTYYLERNNRYRYRFDGDIAERDLTV